MTSLADPVDLEALTPSARPTVEAVTLPRECYVSPAFYQQELASLWHREWVCVGHAGQIPSAGDFFTVTLGDDPLIVARGKDGVVRAFSAVCRHRGMLVAEGAGSCERFLCVYHGWQYDLTGRLVSAPFMGQTTGFDRGEQSMPQLPVEVWKNFIFVTYQPAPSPLAEQLADLEPIVAPYGIDTAVTTPLTGNDFAFNWKVFMEGALECYHCDFLHPGQHDCAPARNTLPEALPDHDKAIVLTVETTHPDASFVPPDYRIMFPPLPGLSAGDRARMHWIVVLPNLLIACYPDSLRWGIALPRAADRTHLEFGTLLPAEVMADGSFAVTYDRLLAAEIPMIQEDFDACVKVQEGLGSSLAGRGRLSWQESTIAHFYRWLVARYAPEG
jgi:phenylpropionate dioxygenase-like ring-hydroxylating dioxygenase large terminal subunit